MPIINVDQARNVFVLKRSMNPASLAWEPLFFRPNTRMLFGDARATINNLIGQFKTLPTEAELVLPAILCCNLADNGRQDDGTESSCRLRRTDSAEQHQRRSEKHLLSLVSSEALASWLPPAGMSGEVENFVPEAGGGYRLTLRYDDLPAGRPVKLSGHRRDRQPVH